MKDLCSLSYSVSTGIFNLLSDAKSHLFQFGEESITDKVLYSFVTAGNIHVYTVPMTKYQEARNGSDWEWWIIPSDSNFPVLLLRIQAKICSIRHDAFDHLYYKSFTRKIYQHEVLFYRAWQDNAIPLYCLFTHIEPDSTHGCMILDQNSYNCCFSNRSRKAVDVLEQAFPMPVLLCMTEKYVRNPSAELMKIIEEQLKFSSKQWIHHSPENIPSYVSDIINKKEVLINPQKGIKKVIVQTGFYKG